MTFDPRAAEDFRRSIRDRLAEQADSYVQMFRLLAATPVPDGAARVIIGLLSRQFTGKVPIVLAYADSGNQEVAPRPEAQRLFQRLASFKPLLDVERYERLTIWTTTRDGRRVAASRQPYDSVDPVRTMLLPALRDAVSRADMSGLSLPVYAGLIDDDGLLDLIYAPARPKAPSFWERIKGRT